MKKNTDTKSNNSVRRLRSARTERLGYILFDNQTATVPCRVRNFSQEGAVLTMDGWMGVPASFSLFVDPEHSRFNCTVISKQGNSAKVSFAA